MFGIVGPNGAGKSIFFNVIAGKERNQGDIFFRKKMSPRFALIWNRMIVNVARQNNVWTMNGEIA
ncbi:MAG: ATP-binding cassette domain-containing protein [Desulfobacterales bacterium]|nr:ATP-binding cassette domain-containing protein [Desulfobacterales bacterium]